jgi:sulfite exporter TauE/SafE
VTGLLLPVIAASVAGSVHCAAMCGPLMALYQDGAPRWRLHLVHAAGRGAAYVTLGLLAGLVGGAVDLAGHALAVQRVAWLLGAAAVIGVGGFGLATALGLRAGELSGSRTFRQGLVRIRRKKPALRAALVGLLSAALPCGWLWAFVALAAAAASPAGGAAVMLAFWLGTLPMMLGLATLLAPVLRRLRERMPVISSIVLIGLGATALWMRAPLASAYVTAPAATGTATAVPTEPTCHGHH